MATNAQPGRRRITIVELVVVLVIAALLAAIIVPVVVGSDENTDRAQAIADVQEAVRRYHAQTDSYPTFGATPAPDRTPTDIWVAGRIPSLRSIPPYAGVDFDASVAVEQGERLTFFPDFIQEKPRHAGDAAEDGTQRWRLAQDGGVSIEMNGRSY